MGGWAGGDPRERASERHPGNGFDIQMFMEERMERRSIALVVAAGAFALVLGSIGCQQTAPREQDSGTAGGTDFTTDTGDIVGKKAITAYMVIMFFVVVLLMAIFLRLIAGLETVDRGAITVGALYYRWSPTRGTDSDDGLSDALDITCAESNHFFILQRNTYR